MAPLRSGLVLIGALVLVVAGCGGDSDGQLNLSGAEAQIAAVAKEEYGANATVGVARCPARVEMKKDNFSFCTVDIDGLPLRVVVTQTNDRGRVTLAQGQAVLLPEKMEAVVTEYAGQHGTPTTDVTCGSTAVLIRTPGTTVKCAVVFADGTNGVARFRVRDVLGNTPLTSLERT